MKMLKREEVLGLVIGLFIVMIVVALTLPTKETLEINRVCYEECKLLVKKNKDRGFWTGATYFGRLGDCVEVCTEEKSEDVD
tara:strand:+ start:311 stop:556 length:246 start_codon:yes stop_codon:yes gene_type:complete